MSDSSGPEREWTVRETDDEDGESETRTPDRKKPEPEMGTVQGPIYYVEMGGGLPDLLFSSDEYEMAYQHATGRRIEDGGHDGEERIHLWDIEGTVEVPIVNA